MLYSKVLFPIVGDCLVESSVIFLGNLRRITSPNRPLLVDLNPLVGNRFDLLLLLFLRLLSNVLNLGLVLIGLRLIGLRLLLLFLGLGLSLVVGYLFFLLLCLVDGNWVLNELRVLLDDFLNFLNIKVVLLILLQAKDNLGTTLNALACSILDDARLKLEESNYPQHT